MPGSVVRATVRARGSERGKDCVARDAREGRVTIIKQSCPDLFFLREDDFTAEGRLAVATFLAILSLSRAIGRR